MTYCSDIPVRRSAVRCVATCCYSHSDVSSCWLRNPSPIMGNQLDHSLLSCGKIHGHITAHRTASNTSINYTPLDVQNSRLQLLKQRLEEQPQNDGWKARKMDCRLLWWQQLAEDSHRACSSGEYSGVSGSATLNSWNRSMHYPTNAPPDTTHMTCMSCYMVWHLGAILMQLSRKRCTSQPDHIPNLLECKAKFFSLNLVLNLLALEFYI
jgi:hypothetical protein